jgi:hypothetical protein
VFNGISDFLHVTINKLIRAGRIAELHKGAAPQGVLWTASQAKYDRGDLDRRGQQSDQGIGPIGVLRQPRLPGRDEIATRPELAQRPLPPWRLLNNSISFRSHLRSIGKAAKITQTKTEQKMAEPYVLAEALNSPADNRKNIGLHSIQNLDEPGNGHRCPNL